MASNLASKIIGIMFPEIPYDQQNVDFENNENDTDHLEDEEEEEGEPDVSDDEEGEDEI